MPAGNGSYQCTLPPFGDLPARTILVNPAQAPGTEGLGTLITPEAGPKTITNTGNQAPPTHLPTITVYPGLDEIEFNDVIVMPLPAGDGKPIYVMLSSAKDISGATTSRVLQVVVLPGGKTVAQFEKELAILPPGERVAQVKEMAIKVAIANNMEKDNKLTKLNDRDVFRATDGSLYSSDTQHGRFEMVEAKNGQHVGELNFGMQQTKPADKTGKHNLRLK